MTDRGGQPNKALSTLRINSISKAGRYGDGNGLYLIVDPSGSKRWVLRTVVHGRRRDIGLGGFRLVTLAEARAKAVEYRKLARDGGNPLHARRAANARLPTFAEAARLAFAQHRHAWKNEKHAGQWLSTLETYVFPTIGEIRIDHLSTPEILKVLSPIWLTKPETARRVKQRIGTVLDWAKAAGHCDGENPASAVSKGLPKQPDRKQHFKALPFTKVPHFIVGLRGENANPVSRLAFEFLILTATRTNETLNAKWHEFDFDGGVWTIPGERMKAGRPHRVPLAARCIEILKEVELFGSEAEYVFPGRHDSPMSNMIFLMILRRMKVPVTAHGFRSAFRDWAAECTNFSREVCEMALAHTIKNKAEAAYRRGDLLDRRRALMGEWAEYITRGVV